MQTSSPKGLHGDYPRVERSDTRGHRDSLHRRTLKACEEIPVEQQAHPSLRLITLSARTDTLFHDQKPSAESLHEGITVIANSEVGNLDQQVMGAI